MPDPFQPVKAGERVGMSASAETARREILRRLAMDRGLGGGGQPGGPASGLVLIRNDGSGDLARFEVVGVTGVVFPPVDDAGADAWLVGAATEASLAEFQNHWCLTGGNPTGAADELLAIAVEPIALGRIGRARLAGSATPARVGFPRIADRYVEADPAAPERLRGRLWYGGEGIVRTPGPAGPGAIAWALVERRVPALSVGWAKVIAHGGGTWYELGDSLEEHWVNTNPCRDRFGTDVDASVQLPVLIYVDPIHGAGQCGARDPNLGVGDVIQVMTVPGQHVDATEPSHDPLSPDDVLYVCLSDVLDDAVGTVKMWRGSWAEVDVIPRGWAALATVVGGGLPDGSVPAYNDDYTTFLTKVSGPVPDSPTAQMVYLMFIVRVYP